MSDINWDDVYDSNIESNYRILHNRAKKLGSKKDDRFEIIESKDDDGNLNYSFRQPAIHQERRFETIDKSGPSWNRDCFIEEVLSHFEKEDRWISVDDAHPENGFSVLAWLSDGFAIVSTVVLNSGEVKYFWENGTECEHVTHWRELPDRPSK